MFVTGFLESDLAVLSQAVQSWYRHFKAKPDEKTSEVICSAAIVLFNQGHRTQEDLTRILIARFPNLAGSIANAPTSIAIH
ncbi:MULTISPECIES: hypothetical protein [unclassified Rhizobium]|uniref:hypothetical protein n=1 Tax=unclassified Rhizobium TaxID=2613769 RepID=UPI00161702CB|nr:MULTISPECIES: hypothetical protein [unclassified Rhizobium]MBB3545511.1 putative intracellular protease/amidase [Rhizobium sp. BK399]MCS3744022.1 putative intracellular protease/amidase [Rhizobium sp. BK661]MCS4096619.1 putative intracellular protease/amidase [Rhizobium sp. BK176]